MRRLAPQLGPARARVGRVAELHQAGHLAQQGGRQLRVLALGGLFVLDLDALVERARDATCVLAGGELLDHAVEALARLDLVPVGQIGEGHHAVGVGAEAILLGELGRVLAELLNHVGVGRLTVAHQEVGDQAAVERGDRAGLTTLLQLRGARRRVLRVVEEGAEVVLELAASLLQLALAHLAHSDVDQRLLVVVRALRDLTVLGDGRRVVLVLAQAIGVAHDDVVRAARADAGHDGRGLVLQRLEGLGSGALGQAAHRVVEALGVLRVELGVALVARGGLLPGDGRLERTVEAIEAAAEVVEGLGRVEHLLGLLEVLDGAQHAAEALDGDGVVALVVGAHGGFEQHLGGDLDAGAVDDLGDQALGADLEVVAGVVAVDVLGDA